MKKLMKLIKKSDGVTAIEYALLAALIAVAIIVVVQSVGKQVSTTFSSVNSGLTAS